MSDKTIIITQDRDQLVELAQLLENRCPGLHCATALNVELWQLVFSRVNELLEIETGQSRSEWEKQRKTNKA